MLIGPTQSRLLRATKRLPFVPSDIVEGAALVDRYYVSEGFVEAMVEPPTYRYVQPDLVDVQIVIHEGQKYFFGQVNFVGPTIYGGEALRRADS